MPAVRVIVVILVIVVLAVAGYGAWRLLSGDEAAPPVLPKPVTWPLTGERAPDRAAARARVVSVKVDNSKPARPQSGLADADVVYEVLAEGGITRFHAIFHSKAPQTVGPVRSARPPDIHIAQQFGSILAFSGANRIVLQMIEDSGIDNLTESTGGDAFERSDARSAPHNLYVDIQGVRSVGGERGFAGEATAPSLQFGAAPSADGTAAAKADVPLSESNQVSWVWSAEARRWTRRLNGEPHVDAESGKALRADNVVVLFAEVVEGCRPGTSYFVLNGAGDARLYRDGRRFPALWEAQPGTPLRLTTPRGERLPLATGTTWIEVVPAADRERFE
ncbi:MAG: DUF3048 domain-containing protein [Coriobacteriales bacterium]|nr:DUF3048 domain-containing protein [Coriobacteriales bacterium]